MMLKIQKNFLPESIFRPIHNWFLHSRGPNWKWQPYNTGQYKDNYQFNISFYRYDIPVHEHYHIIKPLVDAINPHQLLRVKANLHPITSQHEQSGFHVDNEYKNSTTSVFYINTCNGCTIFEHDNHHEYSVENKLVSFPTHLKHCSLTSTDQKCRVVINLNYYTRPTIRL